MLNIKTYIKKSIFTLTLLFYCFQGFSQTYAYKHYTVEDGLPSSEVYSAFQDSKGYMWFATDAGVSRFNGYEFQNFDVSDGLTDNTVFLITEDSKGRIWFGTFNCQLSYFENNNIYPYKYNSVLKDSLKGKHNISSFQIDSANNIWMGFYYNGLKKIDKKGKFCSLSQKKRGVKVLNMIKVNEKMLAGVTTYDKGSLNPYTEILYENLEHKSKVKSHYLIDNFLGYRGNNLSIAYSNDTVLIQVTGGGMLYFNKRENLVKKLEIPNQLHNIHVLSTYYQDGLLYLCTKKQGMYSLKLKSDSMVIKNHFLKDLSISRMYKDNEGGYWFLSLEKGIYYFPSFLMTNNHTKLLINEDNRISKMVTDEEGNLFFSINGKGLLKQNLITGKIEQVIPFNNYLEKSFSYDDALKKMIINTKGDVFSYQNGEMKQIKFKKKYQGKIILSDSNNIYIANDNGFYALENNEEKYPIIKERQELIFHTSIIKKGEEVWIGTNKGIRVYHNKKITDPFSNNKYLSSAITSMEQLYKEIFLIGTKSYGVLVIKKDSIIDIIDEEKGLIGNLVRTIHVDLHKTIWIGTNKGLSNINYQKKGVYSVNNLTKKHGLGSEEITGIVSYNKTVYIATSKGLIEFDKTKIKVNSTPPLVYITTFNINEKKRNLSHNYQLSYKENNVSIFYEGLNYRSLGEIEYQYRMLGVDTNWVHTTTRNVRYPTLQPGEYTFEVKAKNEDNFWSKPSTILFVINPPIWLTWWFITFIVTFVLVLIYLGVKYRIKKLNEKNEANNKIVAAEKRMVELELTALRSQMNPHFIFNTLNTIQNAINTLDKRIASSYIASFGKLIRIVLETSKNAKIRLNIEIEMLTLYIELEAVRFANKFSFNITKDQALKEASYYIPSMVIQPFVENAILHGLVPKKANDLQLKVSFNLNKDDTITCIVEDNGIGRTESTRLNKQKKLNKKSLGMQITKERLDLYYKESGNAFSFKVVDLTNENNTPIGTRVEITFHI